MGRGIGALLIASCLAVNSASAQTLNRDARGAEIAVELAWMNDPITFPYELRAFIKNGVVEVHGVVPSPIVRKQALNIARLFGSKHVLDQTDIAAGSLKSYVNVPSEKVVAAAQARIGRGLPQLRSTVGIECSAEGRAVLHGTASTVAEKLALSEMMRVVPGCLQVENRIQVGDVASAGIVQTAEYLAPSRPTSTGGVAIERICRRIAILCPQAKDVEVRQLAADRFHIHFSATTDAEASRLAAHIFGQEEWKSLRLDVDVSVPR